MNAIVENLSPEALKDFETWAEWLRIYGGEERITWVQQQPSVASGKYPCVNAHTANGGKSRKAGYQTIVPLTWAEHQELHCIGVDTFGLKYNVDLVAEAVKINERWERYYVNSVRPAW